MNKTVKKIVDFLAKKPEILAVYLFGSLANHNQSPKSDIDLAVLFKTAIDSRLDAQMRIQTLRQDIESQINPSKKSIGRR